MKILSAIGVVLLVVAVCTPACAESVLRIARIENIPDQFVGGEMLREVYKRLNIKIELVDLPAKRALMESSSGRLDGEVQRNIRVQEQYPTLLMVRPAINYIEPSVFSKKYRFPVTGWDSIKDYRIGIVRGVGTSEDGTRRMKLVQAITTLEQAMQMLASDRVDVVVSDLFSGQVVIRQFKLDTIHALGPPLQRTEIYHFLHEKHRNLIPRIEKVLREMQASGELGRLRERIVDQYLKRLQ